MNWRNHEFWGLSADGLLILSAYGLILSADGLLILSAEGLLILSADVLLILSADELIFKPEISQTWSSVTCTQERSLYFMNIARWYTLSLSWLCSICWGMREGCMNETGFSITVASDCGFMQLQAWHLKGQLELEILTLCGVRNFVVDIKESNFFSLQ